MAAPQHRTNFGGSDPVARLASLQARVQASTRSESRGENGRTDLEKVSTRIAAINAAGRTNCGYEALALCPMITADSARCVIPVTATLSANDLHSCRVREKPSARFRSRPGVALPGIEFAEVIPPGARVAPAVSRLGSGLRYESFIALPLRPAVLPPAIFRISRDAEGRSRPPARSARQKARSGHGQVCRR